MISFLLFIAQRLIKLLSDALIESLYKRLITNYNFLQRIG